MALGTLLLPPKLALRALDDLHTIAMVAKELNGRLAGLEQRAEAIQEQLGFAIDVAQAIERRGEEAIALALRIDERAVAVLSLGERAEERVEEVMEQARLISERAALVATTGAEVAAALPLLQRALELTEPLEGAVERLGRVVDRLPGGRRAAAKGANAPRPPA
jgi:hypothetical protein